MTQREREREERGVKERDSARVGANGKRRQSGREPLM